MGLGEGRVWYTRYDPYIIHVNCTFTHYRYTCITTAVAGGSVKMTSHEFQVHHLVSELVSLLNIREAGEVDTYAEVLLKNRTPYITTQVH